MQRFLSPVEPGSEWFALSFDVRDAHKLILVDEQEQGFSCFVLDGLLLWRTNGAVWLRPWLRLVQLLLKPGGVVCWCVNLPQLGELRQFLSPRLVVLHAMVSCDILADWKLRSVNNAVVASPDAPAFLCPRVRARTV